MSLNPTIQWITVSGPLSSYLWLEFERAIVWTIGFWIATFCVATVIEFSLRTWKGIRGGCEE